MEELTTEQWMEKFPYLRNMAEYTLFTTKEDLERIRKSERVKVGSADVPIELLKRILTNDIYFEYASKYFNGDIKSFAVNCIIGGDTGRTICYKKCTIIRAIEQLISSGQIVLQPDEQQKFDSLKNSISFEKYRDKKQNDNYEIVIDGNNYKIPVVLFYQFMELNSESFNSVISSGNDIKGIPLAHFLYAVSKYYQDNKIEENCLINEEMRSRLKEIKSSEKVDIQFLNVYLDTDDTLLEQIKVNNELEDLILSDISPEFNDLEKAIYIYIKMCKILTYDEEFYAVKQEGPLSEKHKTIDNIANISLTNNKVVCYEFDAIYSYFLNKLGINYKHFVSTVNGNGKKGEREFVSVFNTYSEGHTYLKYRWGKYLIKVDSVTSIIQGDIMQAKLNQPLVGLVCENTNEQSRNEFYQTVQKVYNYIANKEPKISQNEPGKVETFDEIVAQFTSITDKTKPVDIREKIEILISKVNSTKMVGIDAYSYLLQLRKILFTEQEREDNIKISIIRNSVEKSAEALSIISIRLPDKTGEMAITRYMFKPGSELIPISQKDLQAKFDNDTMGYVQEDDFLIPGIK